MGSQLHETEYGRRFFGFQLPQLIKALNKLAGDKLYECEIISSETRANTLKLPVRKRALITANYSEVVDFFNSYASDSNLHISDEDYCKSIDSLSKRENFGVRFYHTHTSSGEIKEDFWLELSVKVKDIK